MAFDIVGAKGGSGTHDELRGAVNNNQAIRKTLKIAVAMSRPMPLPKSIVSPDGKITVPAGVTPVGMIDPKGVVVKAKTTDDPIKSLGEGTTRNDVVDVERDLAVTIQESHRRGVMEMMLGQDLSATGLVNGELVIDEQAIPTGAQYFLWLFVHDIHKATGKSIEMVKVLTNCQLSEAPGFTLQEKGAIDYDLGFSVMADTQLGTHCRTYIGGPGFAELAPALGWTGAAAPANP